MTPGGRGERFRLGLIAAVGAAALVVSASAVGLHLFDLEVYRAAGQRMLDGAPLYDSPIRTGSAWLWFAYPPFAAVLFVPFGALSAGTAAGVWTVCSLAAAARVAYLVIERSPRPITAERRLGLSLLVTSGLVIVCEPARSAVGFGQLGLIVMWAVVEDAARMSRRAAGVLTGLAAGMKLTALVFVPWYVAVGRARAAAWALGTFAATVAVGFAVRPTDSGAYWSTWLLSTRSTDPRILDNQSLPAALARINGVEGVVTPAALVVAGAVLLAALVAGAVVARRGGEALVGLSVVAIGGLLASPVSWTHHWVWLPFAAGCLWTARSALPGARWLAAVVALPTLVGPHEVAFVRDLYVVTGLAVIGWAVVVALRLPSTNGARPGTRSAESPFVARHVAD